MAKSKWPNRNIAARSFHQLRRFCHLINVDKVFGTHRCSCSGPRMKAERSVVEARNSLLSLVNGRFGISKRTWQGAGLMGPEPRPQYQSRTSPSTSDRQKDQNGASAPTDKERSKDYQSAEFRSWPKADARLRTHPTAANRHSEPSHRS